MIEIFLYYLISSMLVWTLATMTGHGDLAWYDFWIGIFIDRKKRIVYICPLPCFLIQIDLAVPTES